MERLHRVFSCYKDYLLKRYRACLDIIKTYEYANPNENEAPEHIKIALAKHRHEDKILFNIIEEITLLLKQNDNRKE